MRRVLLLLLLFFSATASRALPVVFRHRAPEALSVSVAGSFNSWSTTAHPMAKDAEGVWTGTVDLEPGTYEYKFHCDGSSWRPDPLNPRISQSGDRNSILIFRSAEDLPLNFSRKTITQNFVVKDMGYSKVAVSGEFARWDAAPYALKLDAATGLWRGSFDIPYSSSDLHLIVNDKWVEGDGTGEPRSFFVRASDPARYRISTGYMARPFLVFSDRTELRGRLELPAADQRASRQGFVISVFLNNARIASDFDHTSGVIRIRARGLKEGLNTVAVYARRGAEKAEPGFFHVIRKPQSSDVVAVVQAMGDFYTDAAVELHGENSYAVDGARIVTWRWKPLTEGMTVLDAGASVARIRPSAAGEYAVQLTVWDEYGRMDTSPYVFSVSNPPEHLQRVSIRTTERDMKRGDKPYSVHVAGTFNGWSQTANALQEVRNGVWQTTLFLGPGEYEYKLVVNGSEWMKDPANSITRGPYENSVLAVRGTDTSMGEAPPVPANPSAPDALIYQVMVPRFADSDGDGIGDLQGLTSKMGYIRDLGFNWIYLMPIFRAPTQHGYHTTDYFTIDEKLGTIEDFRAMLDAAHAAGIKVMLDYVINHSSSDHPLFELAHSDPSSLYRKWHQWTGRDGWRGFGADNGSMPRWNFSHPDVRAYAIEIARYWQDQGIDGYRCDVAHAVPDDFWRDWARALKEKNREFLLFPEFDEPSFDLYYDFSVLKIFDAIKADSAQILDDAMKCADGSGKVPVRFLSYHDKDRLESLTGGDRALSKLAAAFLLTAPGAPMIYYGQEIGMAGRMDANTNREMMDWDFGDRELMEQYRRLIGIRNDHVALRRGNAKPLKTKGGRAYAFSRTAGLQTVLVALNLKKERSTVEVECPDIKQRKFLSLLGERAEVEVTGGKLRLELEPYEAVILRGL